LENKGKLGFGFFLCFQVVHDCNDSLRLPGGGDFAHEKPSNLLAPAYLAADSRGEQASLSAPFPFLLWAQHLQQLPLRLSPKDTSPVVLLLVPPFPFVHQSQSCFAHADAAEQPSASDSRPGMDWQPDYCRKIEVPTNALPHIPN
jgi:hypothetical protein